jgi:23S rRNA G2069 N7-methylase RlmK/C1962 C5-methylase RlmI
MIKPNTCTITESAKNQIIKKHPWVFRKQVLSCNSKLNQRVSIFTKSLFYLGDGYYSKKGLIAVRVYSFGQNLNSNYLKKIIETAINKRRPLLKTTNSLRLIHGENDRLPGITLDLNGDTLVINCYSPSLPGVARFVSFVVYNYLINKNLIPKINCVILKSPNRTGDDEKLINRVLRGKIEDNIKILVHKISYTIAPLLQKSGVYNDIRNLRNFFLENKELVKNKSALNLFSNNGLLSIVLEMAGANEIVSVEESKEAIKIHKENVKSEKQKIFQLDIFKNLNSWLKYENKKYDIIIIDPPSLTASEKDKPRARKVYQSLISSVLPYLKPESILVLASCSARIAEEDFERISRDTLEKANLKFKKPIRLLPEIDHPVIDEFPEGKYLKVHIYKIG